MEIEFRCKECGDPLDTSRITTKCGDFVVEITPCDCMTYDLKQEVKDLRDECKDYEEDIEGLHSEKDDLEFEITKLEAEIEKLQNEIQPKLLKPTEGESNG